MIFEGSTADANETTLTVTDPTADARSRCLMQRPLLLVLLLLKRFTKAQRGTPVSLTDAATIAVDLAWAITLCDACRQQDVRRSNKRTTLVSLV